MEGLPNSKVLPLQNAVYSKLIVLSNLSHVMVYPVFLHLIMNGRRQTTSD